MSSSNKTICKTFLLLLLFLSCLVCTTAFAEEIAELSYWSPHSEEKEFLYTTEGDEHESVRVRVSRIDSAKLWDPMLPDIFGGKKIKLRDKEADAVAKLNSSPNLIKAAEPVRWTEDLSHSADDKKKCYHYSLHSYILKNDPKTCIILFFSGDGNGLEQFYLIKRETPFSAGEDFFLYPNVYPANDCAMNNWKADIADWNALSEYEQYFCMLSAPLISNHPQEMFSVNPEPLVDNQKYKTYSQAVLERDWGCNSRADLLELIDGFRNESGFSPMYNRLIQLLAKYPKKTPEDISAAECLTMHDTACLFYVKQMEKKLGEHGMLAWDSGRILGVMRWGIAAGWLSEQEAMQYARPLIDELLNSYASWEDYLAHYVIGRGLFALSRRHDIQEYEHTVLFNSLNYARNYETVDAKHQLSFHGMKFPAKNQNSNPVLTYNDAWYKPTADAKAWEEIYFISTKSIDSISQNDERKMLSFCGKKTKIPCTAALMVILRESQGLGARDLIKYYDSASPAFDKVIPEKRDYSAGNKIYNTFYTTYFYRSLAINDFDRMYKALQKLDDENTIDEQMCIRYSLYYYAKMKKEKDKTKTDSYEKKITGFFRRILEEGSPIGENEVKQIYNWLEEELQKYQADI